MFIFLGSFVVIEVEPTDPLLRALFVLERHPLIDGHNDVPATFRELYNDSVFSVDFLNNSNFATDITRLRQGHVAAQFWSVWTPCETQGKDAVRQTLENIDVVYKLSQKYPATFSLSFTPDDITHNFQAHKISSLIGIEGAHQIDASLGALRMMFGLGARYMTLSHNCNNEVADSAANGCAEDVDCRIGACVNHTCTAEQTIGLTPFGVKVVEEMNRLGMMVDLSHVSQPAMRKALDISRAPVIFSHSNAFTLCPHRRNVPDDVLERLPHNGGVILVVFVRDFICAENASITSVLDMIDYITRGTCPSWANCSGSTFKGIGVDHVGYGSDFDGTVSYPANLTDVSHFVDLTAGLFERNYTTPEVIKIIGGNLLRVFTKAKELADSRKTVSPAETVIWPDRACRTTP
uniref:Dipeptidase n=1 Tax=Arcella intermedia TaxID=1963864 RepID=A0A6B2L5Q2_9EUKA